MEHLKVLQNKICTRDRIPHLRNTWSLLNKKVVFTNGCFDIMHAGHISYLSQARDLGDILVLGLNSDASVGRLKGPNRPIIDENNRALMLAALHVIDLVVLFEEDTPMELLEVVRPDILVKGGDYTIDTIVGADFVQSYGGHVQALPFVEGFSTSNIIEKIANG